MKKKLFTMMTLLLCAVTGAWGETVTIFSMTDVTGPTGNITKSTSADVTATFSPAGSSAEVYNGKGSDVAMLTGGNTITLGGSSNSYFHATFTTALEEGDVITSSNTSGTFKIGAVAGTVVSVTFPYTIPAGSALIGSRDVYVKKDGQSQFSSFNITHDNRSALTLSFVPAEKNIIVDEVLATSLSWTEDTSAESAKYSVSYESDDEAIATVASDGKVTGVAVGTTTITAKVSATADATYKTTIASIVVNVVTPMTLNSYAVKPSSTLDLTDSDAASTLISNVWKEDYGNPFLGNDGASNYVTFSVVGAYSSKSTQEWVGAEGSGSTGQSWDATGNFKGSAYYMSSAKAATSKSNAGVYSFRVKGASKVQALASSRHSSQKVVLAAFEYSGTTPAGTTLLFVSYGSSNDIGTLTLYLDDSKEYLITLHADGTSTNSRLYEVAIFFDEATKPYKAITPSKQYTTLTYAYGLDFTSVISDLKAFIVKDGDASDGTITMTEVSKVPANTGLVLKATTPGAAVNVPILTADPDDVSGNLMAGSATATTAIAENAGYILSDGKFHPASAGTLPAGKAYLALAVSAPVLEINFEGENGEEIVTGIENVQSSMFNVQSEYYNLNGQRVAQPTKGLYIVNGRKVLVK